MAKKKKGQHGGVRSGSGRKPVLDGPTKMIVNLERSQLQRLGNYCAKTHKTKSEVVRGLIDTIKEESDNGRPAQVSGSSGLRGEP
jgi:hypothetical protein